MESLTRNLPVRLTDFELRDRAKELGEKLSEKTRLEAEKKFPADHFKSAIEKAEARIADLGVVVTEGVEYRAIPVTTNKNFDRSLVETIRTDTAEVVDSRPMTADERQQGLFDDGEATTDEEPKRSRRRKTEEAQPEA